MKTKVIFWMILLSSLAFILLSGIQLFNLIVKLPLKPGISEESVNPSPLSAVNDNAYAQDKVTKKNSPEPIKADEKPAAQTAPSGEQVSAESMAEYMKYLRKKEEELQQKEQALREKEKVLKELEKDLDAKLARLEELQKSIEAFNRQQEQLANEKLDALVKIYVTMKPKDAAALLEKLDDDLVTQIISKMSTDQAAKIIATMDIKKAARITQKLTEKKNPLTK